MRFAILLLMFHISAACAGEEICYSLNPASVIDRAFVDALAAARLTNVRPNSSMVCMDESLREKASNIKENIERGHPQECMSFEIKEKYSAVEKGFRDKGLAHWRENTGGPLCYLRRDSQRAHKVVKDALGRTNSL